MKLEDSHGGYHGKSLQEQIRDDLDTAYSDFQKCDESDYENRDAISQFDFQKGLAEGIAHALGVLRSTSADVEWDAAAERYANPVTPEVDSDKPLVCCPDHKRPIRTLVVNETPDVAVFDPDDDFADNEFDEEFL